MNIQNVQIAQGSFRTVEERLSSRKANISEPQVNIPDVQDKTGDSPKVASEKDSMQVIYPPFFPIGNTQDILFIEGVKQLTGESVKSTSSGNVEEQRAIHNKAAKADASAVQHDHVQSADALTKDRTPSVKHEATPGVVLDLKV